MNRNEKPWDCGSDPIRTIRTYDMGSEFITVRMYMSELPRDKQLRMYRILDLFLGYQVPEGIYELVKNHNTQIWSIRWLMGEHHDVYMSSAQMREIGAIVDAQQERFNQMELEETTEFIETKIIDYDAETTYSVFHVDPNENLHKLLEEVTEKEEELLDSSSPKQLGNIKHIAVWYQDSEQVA